MNPQNNPQNGVNPGAGPQPVQPIQPVQSIQPVAPPTVQTPSIPPQLVYTPPQSVQPAAAGQSIPQVPQPAPTVINQQPAYQAAQQQIQRSQLPQAESMDSIPQVPQPDSFVVGAQGEKTSIFAILGLILSLLIAPIGLLVSIFGLFDSKKAGKKGKGLAVAGIILSLLTMSALGAYAAFFRGDSAEEPSSNAITSVEEQDSEVEQQPNTEDQTEQSSEVPADDLASTPTPAESDSGGTIAERNRDTERQTDLNAVRSQLEVYYTNNGYYPVVSDVNSQTGLDIEQEFLESPFGNRWRAEAASAQNEYGYVASPAGCDNVAANCTGYDISVWLEATNMLESKSALN